MPTLRAIHRRASRSSQASRIRTYVESSLPNRRRFANLEHIGSTNAFLFAFPDNPRLPNRRRFGFPDRIRLTVAYTFGFFDYSKPPNRRPFASRDHPTEANRRRSASPNRSQLIAARELRQKQHFRGVTVNSTYKSTSGCGTLHVQLCEHTMSQKCKKYRLHTINETAVIKTT